MRKHLELLLIIKRLSSLLKHGFKLTIPRIEEKIQNCLPYFAVYLWTHIILFLGPSAFLLMIYLFLATKYWWIPVGYATWLYYDRASMNNGSEGRKPWLKNLIRNLSFWKYWARYFELKLVKTCELDPNKNYLIGSHPHGICAAGAFGSFGTNGANVDKIFPDISFVMHTLNCNFYAPLHRDWILGLGVNGSSKNSIMNNLTSQGGGQASVLVIGGAAEALLSEAKTTKLILNDRKGFIKVAISTGADIVPTFTFGETSLFAQLNGNHIPGLRVFQNICKKMIGVAPCIFNGRGLLQDKIGLMPKKRKLTVVVGEPISVEKNKNPSREEIDKIHRKYVMQLKNLHETFNQKYGDERVKLEIH